jgi:uncharacterized protein with NRDE domain
MATADHDKRRQFAQHYAMSGNATAAARAAGVSAASAHSMGYRWLRNREVRAMLREELDTQIRDLAPLAITTLRRLLVDEDTPPSVRLAAARDALDRVGFVPPKREEREGLMVNKAPAEMTTEELEAAAFERRLGFET